RLAQKPRLEINDSRNSNADSGHDLFAGMFASDLPHAFGEFADHHFASVLRPSGKRHFIENLSRLGNRCNSQVRSAKIDADGKSLHKSLTSEKFSSAPSGAGKLGKSACCGWPRSSSGWRTHSANRAYPSS